MQILEFSKKKHKHHIKELGQSRIFKKLFLPAEGKLQDPKKIILLVEQ